MQEAHLSSSLARRVEKNGDEEWHFEPDVDDFGLRAMIKDDETYESLRGDD